MRCTLMHRELPVLDMTLDELYSVVEEIGALHQPEHLPVGVQINRGAVDWRSLSSWWQYRCIPRQRAGLRDALEHLGVRNHLALPARNCGLSLSDQYWIRPKGLNLRWQDIHFFQNPFSPDVGDILFGDLPTQGGPNLLSPDNTTEGMLKKRWKMVNNSPHLLKAGSKPFHQEPLNEIIASRLMRRMGIDHVPYSVVWEDNLPYSLCQDFITPDTELVTARQIQLVTPRIPEEHAYDHFLRCCETLGIPGMAAHLNRMLTVDFLLANEDRHMGNFGAIRRADTLEWQGPAPIYDCGATLWHNQLLRPETVGRCKSKPFENLHMEQIRLVDSYVWLDIATLRGAGAELQEVLSQSPFLDERRIAAIRDACADRIEQLSSLVETLDQDQGADMATGSR